MPTSQEQKVKNTIDGATEQIDRLIKVFRNDGLMWKAGVESVIG